MKGIVLTPHPGAMESWRIVDLQEPLYRSVKDVIGGYMEIVHPRGLPEPYVLLVDEEGRLKDLEVNGLASAWYGDLICGPAIIMQVGMTEEGPDILGLEASQVAEVAAFLRSLSPAGIREEAVTHG